MSSPSSRPDRQAWVGCGVAIAILVVNASASVDTTVDDAWISARYARHAAEGYGLVYNAGQPPVEGYTNLAWVVLLAWAHRLGLPIHATMTWGGLGFAALGLIAATALTRRLAGRWHPTLLVVPTTLALSPHYAVSATNGIETSLFVASMAATLALVFAEGPRARLAGGVALGFLGTVRPEGMGIALLVSVWLVTRGDWRAGAAAVGGVCAIESWRWWTYGAWVPNTFHAKANLTLGERLWTNADYLALDGPFWFVVMPLVLAPVIRPKPERVVVALVAAVVLVASCRVEMWMPAARLLVPALVLIVCNLGAMASDPVRGRVVIAGLGLLTMASQALQGSVRDYDRRHSVLADNPAARAGQHLARHAPDGAELAVRDAGVLAYWAGTGVRVSELHHRALTIPHPDGADLTPAQLPRNPTFLVVTQAREAATGFRYDNDRAVLRRATVPYAYLGRVYQHHHRYYDVYAREDAGLPPLPVALVVNQLGPPPPQRGTPSE